MCGDHNNSSSVPHYDHLHKILSKIFKETRALTIAHFAEVGMEYGFDYLLARQFTLVDLELRMRTELNMHHVSINEELTAKAVSS